MNMPDMITQKAHWAIGGQREINCEAVTMEPYGKSGDVGASDKGTVCGPRHPLA
jgi:hypothetical protein